MARNYAHSMGGLIGPDGVQTGGFAMFDLSKTWDQRFYARELSPRARVKFQDWEDWEKRLLSHGPEGQAALEGRKWGVYDIKGATGRGSYPTGSPLLLDDDFNMSISSQGERVTQTGPSPKRAYRKMASALESGDTDVRLGVAWAGAYTGPSRSSQLKLEGTGPNPEASLETGYGGVGPRHPDAPDGTGYDWPAHEVAQSSAHGLANLNKEMGFTFEEGPDSDEAAAFAHEGWRKSYVDRGRWGNIPKPLPDDCVETVSMTEAGPIFKSTGRPGCP